MLAISPDADPLEPSVVERFHSMVAKLLYVSKRTRPEILFSVNFLCTRVQKPTLEDSVKLGRLLKYLNGSKDDELVLAINETNGKLKMEAYIDAAYGVHEDLKSHSGMMITLGKGTIMGVSSKQKCVSKSSTEAELIAVTDLVGQAMEMRRIAQEIIVKDIELIVYQDNQATIKLLRNGVTGGRSKHIKIRFAWFKESLEAGDFILEHKPTEEMIADGMTKAKQGSDFDEFKIGTGVGIQTATKERAGESETLVVPDLNSVVQNMRK